MQAAPKVHDPFLWGRLADSCRDLLVVVDKLDEYFTQRKDYHGARALHEHVGTERQRAREALARVDSALLSAGVDSATSPVNGAPAPEGPRPSLSATSARQHHAAACVYAQTAVHGSPDQRFDALRGLFDELDALAAIKREPMAPTLTGSALAHLTTAHQLAEAGHHVAAAGELRHAVTEARAERKLDLPTNVDKVLRQIRTAACHVEPATRARALFFLPNITTPELESLSPAQCVLVVESLAGSLAVIGGAK
jgi:hypothetical protein